MLNSAFMELTMPSQPQLKQPAIGLTSTTALEIYLSAFIRWALRITATGECVGETAIALLEQAWDAQKLLWQLREQQDSEALSN
jgi:hypothetical protein